MGERDREHQLEAEIIEGGLNNDGDKRKAREKERDGEHVSGGEEVDWAFLWLGLDCYRGAEVTHQTPTDTCTDTHQAVCGVSVLMCVV